MWLNGRLTFDFKTIANFRKGNGKSIRDVCRQFVVLCQQLGLFSEALVAIDGSKFKAVINRDWNFTSAKLERRMKDIESSINRYLVALDTADLQEPAVAKARTERLQDKIAALKEQMKILKDIEVKLNATPDKQISLTDPDCRSMKTRGEGIVGYNVQTAVDTKHHLIVAHEVTNVGLDRDQLTNMGTQARAAIGAEALTVVADRGYFKSEEILSCHQAGITPIVPKTVTSNATAAGRFGKVHRYWSSSCRQCAIKAKCTPSTERRVSRWEHEDVFDTMQTRLDLTPDSMCIRHQTVEHPYGTIKLWMGSAHFLMKKLTHVSTEMSQHVLAYNLKRVIKILGIKGLMEATKADSQTDIVVAVS
jgi:hypothetical protein